MIVSILDAVTAKMFEELKNQVDNLAQEVALLKEQQALQTGERRWRWAGEGWEGGAQMRKAQARAARHTPGSL